MGTILYVDRDGTRLAQVELMLEVQGFRVSAFSRLHLAKQVLKYNGPFDLVICVDSVSGAHDGVQWLGELHLVGQKVLLLAVTAFENPELGLKPPEEFWLGLLAEPDEILKKVREILD